MVSNKTKDRRAADNSVYVAIAGEVVNRKSVLPRNFVLNGQESASNPLLHIHASVTGKHIDDRPEVLPKKCTRLSDSSSIFT